MYSKNIKMSLLIILIIFVLVSCKKEVKDKYKIGFVTDTEKINDMTRSGKILKGIASFGEKVSIDKKISKSPKEFINNIDAMTLKKKDLIIVNSFLMNNAVLTLSSISPEFKFIIFDSTIDSEDKNITSIMFRTNESSFIAGYLAGLATKTNKIGYIGFEKGLLSDMYEYGFKYGVRIAAKELKKEIRLKEKHVETLANFELGKEIADNMYSTRVDVIYQTVGYTGEGVIESAKEHNKFVIGYDIDQSSLAPNNVLISTVKNYEKVAKKLVNEYMMNKNKKGEKLFLGVKEDAVGIPEFSDKSLYDKSIYNKLLSKLEDIKNGKIQVPLDEESWLKISQND